ncbi:GNAT family N-acetyltransferase [Agromyces sp. SYSU T00194]|uniref:GNAT family N-acetyltransferase n=1 Tax=Agromyces chitinivorans TaxID=3158560 RepID=UPI003394137C
MTTHSAPFRVRPYQPSDERDWVRCRALAFLDTQYYDAVKPHRVVLAEPSISLVAVTPAGDLVGILDIEIAGDAATIDTIATHPDHRAQGIASALLHVALTELQQTDATSLDAWTREDVAANGWYRRNGFVEQYRYLHVYLTDGEDDTGFATPERLSMPVSAFVHGRIEDEAELRTRYRRVYRCTQYVRPVRRTARDLSE